MVCKFHAAMTLHSSPLSPRLRRLLPACAFLAVVMAMAAAPARAEKADRLKPLEVESDLPGKVDLQSQVVVFNGNVVVTKGTMVIRAARIEVRESPEGYQYATAIAGSGQLATFRTKRDNVNEFIEGEAERLEYDGKADSIRFINRAHVKRLRGTTVADEVTGAVITYDNTAELFTVSGGPTAATPSNPTGRVRAVLTPRSGTPAAAEAAASGASR